MSQAEISVDALADWVGQHKKEIQAELRSRSYAIPQDRSAFIAQVIDAPNSLATTWQDLVGTMSVLKAPTAAVTEAHQITSGLAAGSQARAYSKQERDQIVELARQMDGIKDRDAEIEALKSALDDGRLPVTFSNPLLPLIKGPTGSGGGTAFRWWHRCAFCGALGLAGGGPAGGAALCILCAVFGRG
jgi:hypothetical protein